MRRERSFATKREAREWIVEQDTDAKREVWTDPNAGRETFAAVAELWPEAHSYQVAPKTRDNNISMLRCHLLPEFADRRLAGIDAADVQRYVNSLGERRAPKTVRHVLVLLHQILDFACAAALHRREPMRGDDHLAGANARSRPSPTPNCRP